MFLLTVYLHAGVLLGGNKRFGHGSSRQVLAWQPLSVPVRNQRNLRNDGSRLKLTQISLQKEDGAFLNNRNSCSKMSTRTFLAHHVATAVLSLSFALAVGMSWDVANAIETRADGASATPTSSSQASSVSTVTSSTTDASTVSATSTAAASTSSSGLPVGKRYWDIQETGEPQEIVAANKLLLDHAIGTINTMYYDNTGGAKFQYPEFYSKWRNWLRQQPESTLATRDGVVADLKELVAQLEDPYSRYLTRQELRAELQPSNYGFLGLGAVVENQQQSFFRSSVSPVLANLPPTTTSASSTSASSPTINRNRKKGGPKLLSASQVAQLPVITAVTPDSPAERAGLVVGDRIIAVGQDSLSDSTKTSNPLIKTNRQYSNEAPRQPLSKVEKYSSAENYVGYPDLTIAKPIYAFQGYSDATTNPVMENDEETAPPLQREVIVAYRPIRVRLPIVLTADTVWNSPRDSSGLVLQGGNSIVHYELINRQGTIFHLSEPKATTTDTVASTSEQDVAVSSSPLLGEPELSVGYIRLTRFSKASTAGFVDAVQQLEKAGASSFIIDLRNNFGGVIQEAMLTASTLIRDPHAVLCYTLDSRGGFTPHDVEEFVVDRRYPGYLLSSESPTVTLEQVKRETPELFDDDGAHWVPPSSYASLREQRIKRGIHPVSVTTANLGQSKTHDDGIGGEQKNIVLLVNEGTASSAEVFASALHDNGRVVALIGTKTFGKGLIQHTFPMPDGGGLRLTVAEYLTPYVCKHGMRVVCCCQL